MSTTMTFERASDLERASAAELLDDRRSNDRTRFLKQIRIRFDDPSRGEEVATMIDLSRTGLYLTVRSHNYTMGMKLRINLPVTGSEWTCEIMRTDQLPNGNLGIGARILR